MRLAAYCRVSTDREAQLESLENQKAFFAEFAGKYGAGKKRLSFRPCLKIDEKTDFCPEEGPLQGKIHKLYLPIHEEF